MAREIPDDPRTGVNFCAFPAFWQGRAGGADDYNKADAIVRAW
jgi:hypothetical protein